MISRKPSDMVKQNTLKNIGSFGEVVIAVHLLTNQVRAIKVIDK